MKTRTKRPENISFRYGGIRRDVLSYYISFQAPQWVWSKYGGSAPNHLLFMEGVF